MIAALLAAVTTTYGAGVEPVPWNLEVRVLYGARNGPEGLRVDLERTLTRTLQTEGCFSSVVRAPADQGRSADLLLTLTLEDFEDQQVHDTTIAQRHSPGAMPDLAQGYEARISAMVWLSVETVPENATVRSKRFARTSGHRPLLGEDARLEASRKFVAEIVHTARGFACKGSSKKWRREIAAARKGGSRSR